MTGKSEEDNSEVTFMAANDSTDLEHLSILIVGEVSL